MRARSWTSRSIFLLRTRLVSWPVRTPVNILDRSAWRFHVPRIWNRSILGCKFPVKRKTLNVVDVFVPRLFVVVHILLNGFRFNTIGAFKSRATLYASNYI